MAVTMRPEWGRPASVWSIAAVRSYGASIDCEGDRPQEAAADEDPRLRVRIPVGGDRAVRLRVAQGSGDEVVDLAHVPAGLAAHAGHRPNAGRNGYHRVGLRHGDCCPVGGRPPVKRAIFPSSRFRVSSHATSRHATQRSRFDAKWR